MSGMDSGIVSDVCVIGVSLVCVMCWLVVLWKKWKLLYSICVMVFLKWFGVI